MQSFKVNEYITLKLENSKTNIYLKDKKFRQCKYLLIDVPIDIVSSNSDINSIDEASEKLDKSLESKSGGVIPPETEFWGHCSNIQVWVENNYDTRLLHRNLAFPLLTKLLRFGMN